jgi:two-component system, response regulator PdtaR
MAAKSIPQHEAHADTRVVLLAEDEPLIRFDIAEELRQLGFQVIEAGNADEAIDVLKSTARIDLVVTDVRMPGDRNGLDVARAVREKRPGAKVIVMSGHLVPMEKHEHLIDLFVSKPAPGDQLVKAIVELMNVNAAKRGR